jgi:hypothetical protein
VRARGGTLPPIPRGGDDAVGVAVPAGLLVPDVVVARAVAVHAARRELQAGDVLTVAEIVPPSSRTNDRR